ncbi:hypothetical protein WA026_017984 [Henosepilachna vigintioctopunctata]|uniref:Generative cell specific-1/HAP2 domain-containing protein n=1 Tax=Henosepilachna vigintioctopunctata TaxID=420089 RepID=A0AAW1TM11_9CUCU
MKFCLILYFLALFRELKSSKNTFESDSCFKKEANVEVSAILIPCHPNIFHSNCHSNRKKDLPATEINEGKLKDCIKKLMVSVSLTNVQHSYVQSEYVVIDEVYDCHTKVKEKLLYPYVLKIRRTPLLLTYRLDNEGCVKEKSRSIERGHSVKISESQHCDTTNKNLSWLNLIDNKEHATNMKNRRRAVDINEEVEETWKENDYAESEQQDDFDIDSNQFTFDEDAMDEYSNRRKREASEDVEGELPFGVEGRSDISDNKKIVFPKEDNKCSGERVPKNPSAFAKNEENWDSYLASIDDMNYHVYKLQEPSFTHNMSIEIFEKHVDVNEKLHWTSLTGQRPIYLSTDNEESWNENNDCVASYKLQEAESKNSKLPSDKMRLLIPQYPHLRGGPGEFLVIPVDMFTSKSDSTDTSSMNCERNSSETSSLKYPPVWFRQADLEKQKRGYDGKYFLKYFAKVPDNPLINLTDDSQNLTIRFEGSEQNVIEVEIKADYNMILKQHASAVITEVYVDATNLEKTEITVKVTNTALVNAVFYVCLTDCPLHLPADFSNIASSAAVISPQQQHIFTLSVLFTLPKRKFYCSIDVKNPKGDVIAFRRIRFQRRDRCICMWHCSCACLEADKGLKCKPLPIDHYNAAGFHGGLPMANTYGLSTTMVQEYLSLFYHLCLATIIVLLVMGLIKALLGLCFSCIGNFGLRWYFGLPKSLDDHYESNLKKTPEESDDLKKPDTKRRVRITTRPAEFSINTLFFLLFPIILFHNIVVKLLAPFFNVEASEKVTIVSRCSCSCLLSKHDKLQSMEDDFKDDQSQTNAEEYKDDETLNKYKDDDSQTIADKYKDDSLMKILDSYKDNNSQTFESEIVVIDAD